MEDRTYVLYDGTDPVCEFAYDAATYSWVVSAVNTFGADGLVCRSARAAAGQYVTVFYLFDAQGNVCQRLDAQGALLAADLYDAWGHLLACQDPLGQDYDLSSDPFGYGAQHGYYTDRDTDLILCTLRYYDPTAGRWLTPDPIGYAGGFNVYAYCDNNPVGLTDPLGLCAERNAQIAHTVLDVVGCIPVVGEVADAFNAVGYLIEGDYANAGLSAVSLVPVVGDVVGKGGKLLLRNADKVSDVLKLIPSEMPIVPGGGGLPGKAFSSSFDDYPQGSFSIIDWSGYPEGWPKPEGPFRLLSGEEYNIARAEANKANRTLHKDFPEIRPGELHEIHPVKFGGDPTSVSNKLIVPHGEHVKFTTFWSRILRGIQ